MNRPNRTGDWWARGIGDNADLGYVMFVAEFVAGTRKIVVRISHALHTRHPWFTPSPKRWTQWTVAEKPK